MLLLPSFTLTCLLLTYLVWSSSPWMSWLTGRWSLYSGLALIVVSAALLLSSRVHARVRYDLFSLGTLLTWFAYWHGVFDPGAPVFLFFPVYMVLFSVFLSFGLVDKRSNLAPDQIELMRIIHDFIGMRPVVLVPLVLASLLMPGHYLIYPIAMTLLMTRLAFTMCLEN